MKKKASKKDVVAAVQAKQAEKLIGNVVYSKIFNIYMLSKHIEIRKQLLTFAKNKIQIAMYQELDTNKFGILQWLDTRCNVMKGFLNKMSLKDLDPNKLYKIRYSFPETQSIISQADEYDIEHEKENAVFKKERTEKLLGAFKQVLFYAREDCKLDSEKFSDEKQEFFDWMKELAAAKDCIGGQDENGLYDFNISIVPAV